MILYTCISSKYWTRLASGPLLSIDCCSKTWLSSTKELTSKIVAVF